MYYCIKNFTTRDLEVPLEVLVPEAEPGMKSYCLTAAAIPYVRACTHIHTYYAPFTLLLLLLLLHILQK